MHKECSSAFHKEVENFKRALLRATLESHGGNRTHAARVLGLQRTYLLRLMRDFGIDIPPASRHRCGAA